MRPNGCDRSNLVEGGSRKAFIGNPAGQLEKSGVVPQNEKLVLVRKGKSFNFNHGGKWHFLVNYGRERCRKLPDIPEKGPKHKLLFTKR